MLDVITQLVVRFSSKLFGTTVDLASKTAKDRRSLLKALIELYENIIELESASRSAYEEFSQYANGTSVPVVIAVRNRVERLSNATKSFHSQLRVVEKALSIQNPDLNLHLGSMFAKKGSLLVKFDLLTEVAPSHLERYVISYPTILPLLEFDFKKQSFSNQDEIDRELKHVSKSLRKKFKSREIDLIDSASVKVALSEANDNIRAIEKVRMELAEYIRKNVPLESMIV